MKESAIEKWKSQFPMPMKWLKHFCDNRRDQVLTSIRIWEQSKENQTFYFTVV